MNKMIDEFLSVYSRVFLSTLSLYGLILVLGIFYYYPYKLFIEELIRNIFLIITGGLIALGEYKIFLEKKVKKNYGGLV